MKDIILKPGSYLKDTKTTNTKNIPGQSMEDFVIGVLANPTCCVKTLKLNKTAVTQTGTITSGVTVNASAGRITTVALTTGANIAEAPFTVTNSYVLADSVIIATVTGYSGSTITNDLPQIYIDDVVAGSFKVIVGNGGSGTLDGTVTISFVIH
jgi:hypothetical protein